MHTDSQCTRTVNARIARCIPFRVFIVHTANSAQNPTNSRYKVAEASPIILLLFTPTGVLERVKFSPTSIGAVSLLLEHS
jgi:hypothetical protein